MTNWAPSGYLGHHYFFALGILGLDKVALKTEIWASFKQEVNDMYILFSQKSLLSSTEIVKEWVVKSYSVAHWRQQRRRTESGGQNQSVLNCPEKRTFWILGGVTGPCSHICPPRFQNVCSSGRLRTDWFCPRASTLLTSVNSRVTWHIAGWLACRSTAIITQKPKKHRRCGKIIIG